jgi:hypothetical protein
MLKLTILLKRRQGLSHEDFLWSLQHDHAKLFGALPIVQQEVRRYEQFHSLPMAMPGLPEPEFDGIAEFWFDDLDSMFRVFTAEDYLKRIRPEEKKFLELRECGFLISIRHQVI